MGLSGITQEKQFFTFIFCRELGNMFRVSVLPRFWQGLRQEEADADGGEVPSSPW